MGDEVIHKLYWGRDMPETIEMSSEALEQFSGNYYTNLNRQLKFINTGNSLKIEGEGLPQLNLFPENDTTFFPLDFEIQFMFRRDKSGRVEKFELRQRGEVTLEGEKF